MAWVDEVMAEMDVLMRISSRTVKGIGLAWMYQQTPE
jgi:hypothetical protein